MSKSLEIKYNIDDSDAKKAVKVQMIGLAALQVEATKFGTRLEAANKKAADAAAASAKKASDAQAKEAKKAADAWAREIKRATDAVAKEAQRAADAQSKAAQKAANDQAKASQKAGEAQAKASQKAADASARASQKAIAAAQKAADDAAKAWEKGEQRALDAAIKAASARNKAAAKDVQTALDTAQKKADAEIKASHKAAQAEVDRVAKLNQLGKQQLSQDEVNLRARAQANQKFQRQRVDDAAKAMSGEKASWHGLSGWAGSAATAVTGVAAAYATLSTGKAIVMGISDAWAAQRRDIEQSVLRVIDYEAKLKQLAVLQGKFGKTTSTLGDVLQFRGKTGQSAAEALQFQEGILNTGQASMKSGFINKAEFGKLSEKVGAYQVASGGDPTALGNLAGTFPSLIGDQNQSGDDVARRIFNISKIFEEGASTPQVAVSNFMKNSGLSSSKIFKSPEQQAGLQSLLSLDATEAPGVAVDQFVRGTVGALSKVRGTSVEGDEKAGDYVRRIRGTSTTKDPIEIGKMIAADLKSQEEAATKAGKDFSGYEYLAQHGYEDDDVRRLMLNATKRINSGQYAKTFEPMSNPKAGPTLAETQKDIDDYQRTNPVAQAEKANLASDLADASRGTGAAGMYLNAQRLAFERLRAQGKTYGTFEESQNSNLWAGQIDDEVQREAFERAQKAGVNTDKYGAVATPFAAWAHFGLGAGTGILGGDPIARTMTSEKTRAQAYQELEIQTAAAGGKGIDLAPLLAIMQRQIDETVKVQEAINKGQNPRGPQVPATPPLMPARPPAAGARPGGP